MRPIETDPLFLAFKHDFECGNWPFDEAYDPPSRMDLFKLGLDRWLRSPLGVFVSTVVLVAALTGVIVVAVR